MSIESDPNGGKRLPGEPGYEDAINRQFNKRFKGRPDYVRPVTSTAETIAAVQDAVNEGRRVVATSGGQCLEAFVSDPDVKAIVDVAPMKRIEFDAERRAVMVEAGATIGDVYRTLGERWGVLTPLGEYPKIGTGGHVAGGGFGFLCRQHGLAVDFLYAVEVVTVDATGRATSVIATRDADDPHRELWWAHTGGGAGNFGIVTRQWFRAPNATGNTPQTILPAVPKTMTTFKAVWNWSDFDRTPFHRMVQQFGDWGEKNSDPGSPDTSLWLLLELHRQQLGHVVIRGVSSAEDADSQIERVVSTLGAGLPGTSTRETATLSWLDFALNPFPDMFGAPPGGVSVKVKDALLKRALTDRQIDVAYDYLTRADYDVMGGMVGLATYGGQINAVTPDATASRQRDAKFDMACTTGWLDPNDEVTNLDWVRACYRELFADTRGVPIPGDRYGGTYINHPDVDLVDATLNTSGVPWHTFYYGDNYPRLQQAKRRWDPTNVFRHGLSIR
jgi:aclacinomycin oxidase